jgi:hypothetical protein
MIYKVPTRNGARVCFAERVSPSFLDSHLRAPSSCTSILPIFRTGMALGRANGTFGMEAYLEPKSLLVGSSTATRTTVGTRHAR